VVDPEGHAVRSLRFRQPRRFRLPVILVVLIAFFVLLALVRPISPQPDAALALTARASLFPLPPTFTLPAQPTEAHGGRIVFTCTRGEINQLCLINADGSGLERLTGQRAHDYYPAFIPQGGSLVFASNRGGSFDLYLMLLKDGKLYQLTQGIGNVFSPTFSPDGKMIVFANQPASGPASLWIMESTGRDAHPLYSGVNPIVGADWSPDGRTLAFAMSVDQPDAYEVFLLDLNEIQKAPQRVTRGLAGLTGSLDWSPDGKYLLLCAGPAGDKDIFRLEVATGEVIRLTAGGNNAAAAYSPDGQWIAFNSLRNDGQADLFIMEADGTYQRQLTDDPEPDWQPQWEP
jgi:TolB protein